MPHEDFFEAQLIEFSAWNDGREKILAKYDDFDKLPPHLKNELKNNETNILFQGKHWKILEINQNLRSHGKGMHVKIRLEQK